MIALTLVSPLHTGHKVVELVRIEARLIAHADAAERLLPTGPGGGERIGTETPLVIASPTCLTGILRIVQAVGHHIKETGCVALDAPFVIGVFFAQGTLALNMVPMLLPVALAQFTLLLPGAFVPDELQIVPSAYCSAYPDR